MLEGVFKIVNGIYRFTHFIFTFSINILFGFHSIVEYWEVKVFLIVSPLVIIIRK